MKNDRHGRHEPAPRAGLRKDEIRHIVLDKLQVVYDDWGLAARPFGDFMTVAGERREDARAFVIALVAALVGGFAEAMDRNNALIAPRPHRRSRRRDPRPDAGGAGRDPTGYAA